MEETKDKVSIDLASEIASYNIEGKWNDYIGVQKNVIETLRNEKFFDNNTVTMMIPVWLLELPQKESKRRWVPERDSNHCPKN